MKPLLTFLGSAISFIHDRMWSDYFSRNKKQDARKIEDEAAVALEQHVIKWVSDNGDKTLRLNYSLDQNSVVVDLGGYEGQWASDIFSMHQCNILVFEPVETFFTGISNRFHKNKKIHIYQHGLSNETKSVRINIDKNASSAFKTGDHTEVIQLVSALEFFNKNKIHKIDLLKINIEGGEYDLLDHLIESGFIKNINNIQVQFHSFFPDAENRMKTIQNALAKTHHLTYQYNFVWENWERNTA